MAELKMLDNYDLEWDQVEELVLDVLNDKYQQGFLNLDLDTGQFSFNTKKIDFTNGYLFTGGAGGMQCFWEFNILFGWFGLIPSGCQRCWKNKIPLSSFYETVQVYELLNDHGITGKAGCDTREYTNGVWSAYTYDGSFDLAASTNDTLKDILPDHINPKIQRGCTEMNNKMPSNSWIITETQTKIEAKLLEFIQPPKGQSFDFEWVKSRKMRNWIKKAYSMGDMSWKILPSFTDKELFPQSLTYARKADAQSL